MKTSVETPDSMSVHSRLTGSSAKSPTWAHPASQKTHQGTFQYPKRNFMITSCPGFEKIKWIKQFEFDRSHLSNFKVIEQVETEILRIKHRDLITKYLNGYCNSSQGIQKGSNQDDYKVTILTPDNLNSSWTAFFPQNTYHRISTDIQTKWYNYTTTNIASVPIVTFYLQSCFVETLIIQIYDCIFHHISTLWLSR